MNTPPPRRFFVALLAAFAIGFSATTAFGAESAARNARKKIVMLVAEAEYETAKSLPEFAASFLKDEFRVVIVSGKTTIGDNVFDRIEDVADADLLLVSVRRNTPPKAQLDLIRRHVASGKPVVGIRTASHAFALLPKQKLAEGFAIWPEFDAEVIGGSYTGHHRGNTPMTITATQSDHPILKGVKLPFTSHCSLYKVSPLRPGAQALLNGEFPGAPAEPVAWTFKHVGGGRTFSTPLGDAADFKNPSFTALLRNGIRWAAGTLPGPASSSAR